jgi:hypothetical protein
MTNPNDQVIRDLLAVARDLKQRDDDRHMAVLHAIAVAIVDVARAIREQTLAQQREPGMLHWKP